jgi:hypothetical protein
MAVQDVIVASVPVADKEREGVLPRKAGVRAQQGGRLRSEMRWILVAPEGHQHADAGRLATVDPSGRAGAGARSDHFPSCPTLRTLAPIARGAVSRRSLDSRLNAGLPALNASRASGLGGER